MGIPIYLYLSFYLSISLYIYTHIYMYKYMTKCAVLGKFHVLLYICSYFLQKSIQHAKIFTKLRRHILAIAGTLHLPLSSAVKALFFSKNMQKGKLCCYIINVFIFACF